MNILVNLEIYRIILNNLILMYINISSEVKKIMLKNQTCDLLSIHKQVWLPAVKKTHMTYKIAVLLKFTVIFWGFSL